MTKDMRIGDKTVPGVANAFTPILYRNVFKRDFMIELQNFAKLKGKKPNEYTDEDTAIVLDRTQAFARLAFIMKEQATDKSVNELVKLSELDFYEWLEGFGPSTFSEVTTIADILALWRGNDDDAHIEPKNA